MLTKCREVGKNEFLINVIATITATATTTVSTVLNLSWNQRSICVTLAIN